MKNKICVTILLFMISIALMASFTSATTDTLLKTDFQHGSFSKIVDYFDYARAYATLHGLSTPDNFDQWHANMFMTYINVSGIQLLYAGLENITTDESGYLRIPTQSILLHYKANGTNEDVLTASTFLMLMAFNDSSTSRYAGSPDVGDNLYASYSLGFDYSSIGATLPALNSKTEITSLTSSNDGLQWSWGMKYTNLTALWWKTWIDPKNAHFDNSLPFAVTTYDEIAFTYTLTIDPAHKTAILTENHIIGRMRDMLIGSGLVWFHLNNTGTFGLLGRKISDQTIYDFLDENNIKMSIVNYQTTILANHNTYSTTSDGQSVDTDQVVTDSVINTYSEDGNKIGSLDFSAKPTYNLYNFQQDPTESTPQNYDAVTRTANASGFAANTGLFKTQINLMKFLPLVVVNMHPALFQKASESISDMSKANYFYITSYPSYSGYRVEHDPVLTVYMASSADSSTTPTTTETTPQTNPLKAGLILVIIVIIAATIIVVALVFQKKISKLPQI